MNSFSIQKGLNKWIVNMFSMVKQLIFLTLLAFSFSAFSIDNKENLIILQNGYELKGEILRIGSNSVVIRSDNKRERISISDIKFISLQEELSELDKYRLGELDGRRYATNSAGNFAVGALFGILGAVIVYSTAEQTPLFILYNGPNKNIVDDASYLRGYAKGSRIASGDSALFGSILNLIPLILLL